MNIIKDFIPEKCRNRPGYTLRGPEYITIHSTGNVNPGANAAAHSSYLRGAAANVPASWHFTVDDKEIRQHLPLDEVAWHAGDGNNGPGNRSSIAIEICENKDGDLAKAINNAAQLTAYLLQQLKLGLDRIKQHYDWSGKNCPRIFRNTLGGWERFLDMVRGHLSNSKEDKALTPIMGEAVATKGQARAWLQQKAPDWVLMADLYWSIAPRYNIRPDAALCQACKETGFFRFGGLVKPEQNNFCGLGATGLGNPGHSFPDRATGVEAHIQHLYAYATDKPLPKGIKKVDPRFDLVRRGSAPYMEWLGAAENPTGVGWAYPGHDYGKSIVRDYLEGLLSTEALPEENDELKRLREENEQLKEAIREMESLRDKLNKIRTIIHE